ncbi:MAG: metalloregulator ArsR/SmtB family transcription factor [Candidatus Hydrogenedens sp.]|nr:metalloregulator ArsR/SmtB family transcription factor [Candidatus Hydrogenedens sp.]
METKDAIDCLQSLAQETRLAVFRALVRAGHRGLAAGDLSAQLAVPPPTLTFHLKTLAASGIIQRRREGRQQWYSVSFEQVRALMDFLMEDCCQGSLEHEGACATEMACCATVAPRRMRVLFLCTGNSCRSQMAEGWARALKGDCLEVWSAGIKAHGMNPYAVCVMAEAGVDLSAHTSKTLDDLDSVVFDHVVTVCSNAHETCPVFPGAAKVTHTGFDDPPALAADLEDEEAKLAIYRRVRDEIRDYIKTLPEALED